MQGFGAGQISDAQLQAAQEAAVRDTIARWEETESPVITDGEQTKPSSATYPLAGLSNLAADGVVIPFAEVIPVASLGTTDDCGFAPFADDTSTSRDIAFAKVRSRVKGTAMASQALGV
jgi:methionine synthase II (cobalamin-independent)